MRVATIILENFRSYKALTRIPISNLTGFIGKNDAGKSTILEALDIFFEGKVIKIEPSDASKGGDAKEVRIGVVFEDLPAELILDSNALTEPPRFYRRLFSSSQATLSSVFMFA